MAAITHRAVDRRFDAALASCEEELRRVRAERTALRQFARAVRSIEPTTVRSAPAAVGGATAASGYTRSASGARRRIRRAYEGSVMSVDHYEADYGDSYPESVSREFGVDLANALVHGTGFDPRCKRQLQSSVAGSIDRRELLRAVLEDEIDAIEGTRTRFLDLVAELDDHAATVDTDDRFGTLDGIYSRLDRIESRCEELLQERQATIQSYRDRLDLAVDDPDAPVYTYGDLTVSYPVLTTGADVLERIADLRADVETAMASSR